MAVAVQEVPKLVLDEEYRIVEVGARAQAGFGPLEGRRLWDAFPDARPLFEPYYEQARSSGEPVEFVQFYDGRVMRIRAVPQPPHLLVYWGDVHRLDTLTLETLRASLGTVIRALEAQERSARRERAKAALRLLHGGAA